MPRFMAATIVSLAALACASASGEAAWDCFVAASSAHGLPRQLLSDNHVNILSASLIHQQIHSPNLECDLDAF